MVNNKALVVGINEYPNCPLAGCVNDAEEMGKMEVQTLKLNMHWISKRKQSYIII